MKLKAALLLMFLSSLAMAQQNPVVVQQSYSAAGTYILSVAGFTNHTLTFSPATNTATTGCLVEVDSGPTATGPWTTGGIITSTACNEAVGAGGIVNVTGVAASYARLNVTAITAGTIKVTYSVVNPAVSKSSSGLYTGTSPIVVSGYVISCPTCGTGTGTVLSFSAGDLSPLFTTSVATPTTTPALSFALATAGAHTVFGNLTGSTALPSFVTTQGTDPAVLTAGTVAGTGATLCTDANGGATTSACSAATIPLGTAAQIPIMNAGATAYVPQTVSQDGVITSLGVLTVQGIDAVPLCAGYTPTNGEAVTYTTGGSPNPCYSALPVGSGITGSGTPNQVIKFIGTQIIGNTQITDDGTNPVRSPNGYDIYTNGAYTYEIPNNAVTGTTNGYLACDDGTGAAIICNHTTSTTNQPIGFVLSGGGTTGNAIICQFGWCSGIVDNSATALHYAIGSPTVDGELHDNGTAVVGGQANFFLFTSNVGAGTASQIRLLISDYFLAFGGFVNPMTTLGDIITGGTAGAAGRLGGCTSPNGVPCVLTSTASGGVATAPAWALLGVPIDASNPATLLATDRTSYLNWTSGSTLTLPAIAGAFANSLNFVIKNTRGGPVALTPTSPNNIDGGSSQAPTSLPNNYTAFVYSDIVGPNWYTIILPNSAAVPLVYALQINGSGLTAGDTINFNDTTPVTASNGLNIKWQTSKSGSTDSVSAYVPGDGTSTHYLSGAGTWTTPPGTYSLPTQYTKGACTEVWGGSGTSNAMQSGDDAIVNNSCYNDSGVTRTITALKCRSDNAGNITVLTPTFGSAGTVTAILTGTVTCGNSYAYSATGTLANTAWTTGTGVDPGMSTVGNATSIAMIVEYTF
jgi:hypothetical protein